MKVLILAFAIFIALFSAVWIFTYNSANCETVQRFIDPTYYDPVNMNGVIFESVGCKTDTSYTGVGAPLFLAGINTGESGLAVPFSIRGDGHFDGLNFLINIVWIGSASFIMAIAILKLRQRKSSGPSSEFHAPD